ncbi:MAG: enoyl-CoA hydratase-related protein [Deltaproteobacteria bacterium]|nr:enoyl-CoA hydratase-related protein [Deltaproteobacteria bacterium]
MKPVNDVEVDGVYKIILNRPEKRNALNSELLTALRDSVLNAEKSKAQIVILRGSGGFFSAGGDIKEFLEAQDAKSRIDSMAMILNDVVKKIRTMSSLWISVVEGGIVGAGIGLALCCDITVAAKSSYINMGYRRIGLTPDGGVSVFLPKLVGMKRMNQMYLFSENISMEQARDMGLVNFVVDDERIDTFLDEMIRELKKLPLHTISAYKELINASLFPDLAHQLEKERFHVAEMAGKDTFKRLLENFVTRKG